MKRLIPFSLLLLVFLVASLVRAQDDPTVYVTKTGSKYHTAGCSYLSKSAIPIKLSEVNARYTACSRCKPPTVQESASQQKQNRDTLYQSKSMDRKYEPSLKQQETYSGRCQATTKKGTQCKRKAQAGSRYCWQHSR